MSVERHDIQEENVGAYLLGALTGVEERVFERHLEECPVCSDEVSRLRPAADALPRSVTPVSPPPTLKTSLMKIVEADARERSRAARSRGASGRPRPLAALRERLAATGEALTTIRPQVAWVGVSLVLVVGIVTGYAATRVSSENGSSGALAAKVDKERVPGATGSLTVSGGDSKSGVLRVHGMPALENDSVYQVWVLRKGETISQSLFHVGRDGEGLGAVSNDIDGADAVLVTREQAGGARAPSGDPVLSVSL